MTKYQLILPLVNEDENDDRFLVPALLLELPTKQVESARLVGYSSLDTQTSSALIVKRIEDTFQSKM